MAIFRFGGGNNSGAGIKKYLEEGIKEGREKSRDEIDERIILEGDLEICDRIIESRETDGERYDHITLSFKEEDISAETLKAITADFKEFVFAAYGESEIYLYAEAHMPKTATEQKWNSETKQYETVDRFPHIHFVIPKTNLVTGERASPFELLSAKYASKNATSELLDAFQETINAKYGLASPKDNRRTGFVGKADILSRIKDDVFTGRNRETLTMIREKMYEQNIDSPEAFRKMLEGMGKVTEGKGGEYLQLKMPGETQNVRLKDYQFSKEFLSLPLADKLAFYEGRKNSPEHQAAALAKQEFLLKQWADRAREIKYLSPSSKIFKEEYSPASPEERTLILDRLEAAHFTRLATDYGYTGAATIHAQRFAALTPLQQTEALAYLETPRIEAFSNAKLNATQLRTTDELRDAAITGQAIIQEPASVIAALTFSQSHFNEAALEHHLLKNTADQTQYDEAMRAVLACPELVIYQGEDQRKTQFTSAAIVAIEKRLTERAERMGGAHLKAVSATEQQAIIDARPFNDGQREAFRLLCSEKQLAVVNGAAGTGKSYVLAAMREAYEKEGFKVYGAILQGKTAEDLERDSGIQSRTIARMLTDLDKGTLRLNSKSVIVVDEAGMVGSRDMEKLMGYVEEAGARIRLVGDAAQLAAVEYGNAFVEVSKRAEVARLTQIMRQNTEWMRKASEKFATHDIGGLQDYADKGHVHLADTTKDAQIALVKSWSAHRAEHSEQSRIVLAHTNADRVALNDMMREALKAEGALKNEVRVNTTGGVRPMAAGEKIMFTRADKAMGVKNGTTGTVLEINDKGIVTVLLESGTKAAFNANQEGDKAPSVDYAYAVTVHKSQGMTLDKAFVLADAGMTKENLGVAMTRHRDDVELHASAEQFATIPDMVRQLDRAGQKAFTSDKDWESAQRSEDSVIGQYVAELNAARAIMQAAKTAGYKELVGSIEAKRVLDHVSKLHGIDPSKYAIVIDKDGKQFIKHGDTTRDAAAFLTKTLHLNYKTEAAPILKQCYAEQLAKVYSEPRREPGQAIDQTIPRGFAAHLKARVTHYKSVKEAIDQTKRSTAERIAKSDASPAEKKAALAALAGAIKAEKNALKAEHDKPNVVVYKDFLAARGQTSALHLKELGRVSVTPADKARLAVVTELAKTTPPAADLSHLTPSQLNKGIENVINRSPKPPAAILARGAGKIGRPADQLIRPPEPTQGTAAPAPARGRGVHELPAGGLDAARTQDAGMLLPNALHAHMGNEQSRHDQDVRRPGASATGSGNQVTEQSKAAPVASPAEKPARADIAHRAHLTDDDRILLANIEKSIAATAKDRDGAIPALAQRFKNLDAIEKQVSEAAAPSRDAKATFDEHDAALKARSLRGTDAETAVNAEAKARGIKEIPFPQPADNPSHGYGAALGSARHELAQHLRNNEGGRAAKAETARLQAAVSKWEKEHEWRDASYKTIGDKLAPRDAERIERTRQQHADKNKAEHELKKPARERLAALVKERDRLRMSVSKKLTKEKQHELEKSLERGIERSR